MSSTAKPIKVKPGAVYIQDCVTNQLSKLYTLDLATGKATFVGEILQKFMTLLLSVRNYMDSIETVTRLD